MTLYAIQRTVNSDTTEVAEHSDGALKIYEHRWKANDALMGMNGPNGTNDAGWRVDEILVTTRPPRTSTKAANGAEGVKQKES